jgi:superfamily I DNA and/or RNA helicase
MRLLTLFDGDGSTTLFLDKEETMPADRGLFLDHTWRLAPKICEFTSEMFYENRLYPREQLAQQKLMVHRVLQERDFFCSCGA